MKWFKRKEKVKPGVLPPVVVVKSRPAFEMSGSFVWSVVFEGRGVDGENQKWTAYQPVRVLADTAEEAKALALKIREDKGVEYRIHTIQRILELD